MVDKAIKLKPARTLIPITDIMDTIAVPIISRAPIRLVIYFFFLANTSLSNGSSWRNKKMNETKNATPI